MTTLTIDLAPELYERLRVEAQRQGKAAQLLAEELLAGQLRPTEPDEVPLYVQMQPQIHALVATMNPADLIVPGNATPEATIALLRSWTAADSADDDADAESWEDVMRSIDANRSSDRKLL
jgi:hypothetical protein